MYLYIGIGLVVALGAFVIVRRASGKRPINDIVTDTSSEGLARLEFKSTKPPQPYRRYYPEVQKQEFPDFGPLYFSEPLDHVWNVVKDVVANERDAAWEIKLADDKTHELEFVAVTRLMRFRDDIKVVVWTELGKTRVDARSKSRLGRGDLNANYNRLVYLFDKIKSKL